MPDKAGVYDATQLIAKFKAQGRIEKEILPGFEEARVKVRSRR